MAIESIVETAEGFIRVTNSGLATAASLREMTDRLLLHPLIQPGSRVLLDNRAIDYSVLTAADARERATEIGTRIEVLASFRIAVVVDSVADFGTQRIRALIAGQAFPAARGFTSMDEAIAWLTGED